MQLSKSIFCLIFLAGVHLDVCSVGGQIESEAANIAPQFASGDTTPACVTSVTNIPAGWVLTETKSDPLPSCPSGGPANQNPLISVSLQNLNGMEPGSTAIACVSKTTILPVGWVITKAAATTTCQKVGNDFYATAVIKNIAGLNTINACVTSVDNIPEGWVASSVSTTGNGNCPNVFKAIQFAYVTLSLLGSPGTPLSACLTSLKHLPTGWLVRTVSSDSACGTIDTQRHVFARLISLTSLESSTNKNICIESVGSSNPNPVQDGLLIESTKTDAKTCPKVNGVVYLSAAIVNVA
jgi:hypothetical protein